MSFAQRIFGFVLIAVSLADGLRAQPTTGVPEFPKSSRLQAIVDRAAATTLEQFKARSLTREQLAITLVDLRDPSRPERASYRGDVLI